MEIALGILFSVVVVLHPLIRHLILAVLLFVSGLFTNLVQAICFVCIWPISANGYTRINGVVKEMDWRVLLGLVDWCAGVKILEFIELETSQSKWEEHELILSNARSDADPLMELVLAQWSGCLGSLLAVIKTSARYTMVIRRSVWISEYDSSRSCVDESDSKDFPLPFWLYVVLERTGFTQGDLVAALPVCSKVVSSDVKDLVYAVRCAYSAVPDIYALTVIIPKKSPAFTLESVIKGAPSVVHVYIKRYVTNKWPESDHGDDCRCTDKLAAKVALFDKHIAEHTFDDKESQAIGQPPKCFLVVISLLLLWALKFNFVFCATLLVLSAALFTGRVLALFGCGVLSMLHCFLGAAIANVNWSDHLKTICGWLIYVLGEWLSSLPCD